MYLVPNPKSCVLKEGHFSLKSNTEIFLGYTCDFDDLEAARLLQDEVANRTGFKLGINKVFANSHKESGIYFIKGTGNPEAYKLNIKGCCIQLEAATGKGIFYGVQTLRQIVRQYGANLPQLEIEDEPHFANRGFYHDVTRGKVPTLETLKELVDRAVFYKLNQIQLYVEHSFAFKGMSEIWRDKDPLTAEEILLLDAYCQKRHVELVPSLSTFGHLYELLRTPTYSHLCELENSDEPEYSFIDRMAHHTLDVSNPESIKVVEDMLNQFIPLFSSAQFNICCDETFDLGKGRSKAKADEIGVGRLYTGFLNQVIDIVKGHGKEVMFWGDVISHYPDLLGEIPEDVICLTWDYCSNTSGHGVKTIADTGRKQYVCPGVGGWNMFMNTLENSFNNISRMIRFGKEHGAIGLLNTDWGDYGHINLLGNSIPGMAFGGALSWNPEDDRAFDEMYKALSCIEYGDQSESLVGVLSELGSAQALGWGELIRWKEAYPNKEEGEAVVRNMDPSRLIAGYNTACAVEDKLTNLVKQVRYNNFDMQEFLVSTRAIQLMNAYFLNVLKYEMGNELVELVKEGKELATDLEVWFDEYSRIWRERNKESELYRIKEVVLSITNDLRKYA